MLFASSDGNVGLMFILMIVGLAILMNKITRAAGNALKNEGTRKAAAKGIISIIGRLFK